MTTSTDGLDALTLMFGAVPLQQAPAQPAASPAAPAPAAPGAPSPAPLRWLPAGLVRLLAPRR